MTAPIRLAGEHARPITRRAVLTEASVARLECPSTRQRVFVYDEKVKGLACQVTRTGARAYYYYGRVKGGHSPIKHHLGDTKAISLDAARRAAQKIGSDAAHGIDPTTARRAAATASRGSVTVHELWEQYRDQHLKVSHPASLAVDKYRIKHLSSLHARPIATLKEQDVVRLHEHLTRTQTKSVADKSVKMLRRMLTWGKVKPNPASGAVTFHGDQQRDRFLTRDEVVRLLAALDKHPSPIAADAVRFALFTGARRGNVLAVRWADVHLDADVGIWIIPKDQSKNGRAMTINLSPPALEVLQRRRELAPSDAEYVFPGHRIGRPLVNIHKPWAAARKAAGLTGVHFHDLRHTLASWMAMSGASLLVIGKQLGHASKQSTARYAHLEIGAARQATDAALAAMMPTNKKAPGE